MTPNQIRDLRARFGESQPAFAERIGVDVETLRSWEQGRRHPSATAKRVLAMLDADADRRDQRRQRRATA